MLWQGILTGCCVLGDPDRCRVFPAATRSWRKRHTAGELLTGACSPCPSNAQQSDRAGTGDVGAEEACRGGAAARSSGSRSAGDMLRGWGVLLL